MFLIKKAKPVVKDYASKPEATAYVLIGGRHDYKVYAISNTENVSIMEMVKNLR